MFIPSLNILGAGGIGKIPTITYNGYVQNSSPSDPEDYTLSFGDEANRDVVVVVISGRNNGSLTSVTIGGQSATIVVGDDIGGFCWLAQATGVTGTSGTVTVDWDQTPEAAVISSYSIYNVSSTTPVSTGADTQTGVTTSYASDITGASGGVVISAFGANDGSGVGGTTWSTTDSQSITEDYDVSSSGNSQNPVSGSRIEACTSDNFRMIWSSTANLNSVTTVHAAWK